jgi:CarD family transcriptional regulator
MAQKTKVQAKARKTKAAGDNKKAAARVAPAKAAESRRPAAKVSKKPAATVSAKKPALAKAPEGRKAALLAAVKKPAQTPAAAAGKPGASKSVHAPEAKRPISVGQPVRVAAALAAARAPGQKLTSPVQPATPKAIAEKAAAARQVIAAQKKPVNQRHGFKTNEFIVYPAHGVGRIIGIEEQEIAGMSLELFVINFDKEKLTLRVPTGKLQSVGMRKLAEEPIVKKAMETLKGRARVKRTMWSRRAQEYVAKINSGDLISIAEVVRDLYRSEAQPEQSYSERQLYEDALDRMAREIAAVEKLDERGAVQRITEILSKSARGRRLAEGADGESKAA